MNYLLLYHGRNLWADQRKEDCSRHRDRCNENGYHPIRDYLNGLSWDGQERIRYCLHHFLGADSDQYTYEALRPIPAGSHPPGISSRLQV